MIINKKKLFYFFYKISINFTQSLSGSLLVLTAFQLPLGQVWAMDQALGQLTTKVTLASKAAPITLLSPQGVTKSPPGKHQTAHTPQERAYQGAYSAIHHQHLSAMESNDIVSNAYAFSGLLGTEVNPRDGQVKTSMQVADLVTDDGRGPGVKLSLSYSSGSQSNLFNLGAGWSWNLGMITATGDTDATGKPLYSLSTSGGLTLMFRKDGINHYTALYHKMDDYQLKEDGGQGLLLSTKEGETTHFNRQGIEDWLELANGYRTYFNITRYGKYYQLNSICGEQERGQAPQCIQINYAITPGIHISVKSLAANGKPYEVHIAGQSEVADVNVDRLPNENQQRLTSKNGLSLVNLPSETNNSFQIKYLYQETDHPSLLTAVIYPTGSKEVLRWDYKTMKVADGTSGAPAQYLPVVIADDQYPDANKLTDYYEKQYKYHVSTPEDVTGTHNYLGYDARHPKFVRGEDNLMERGGSYDYSTEEIVEGISTVRTYNRFHLLIDEKKYAQGARLLQDQRQNYQNVVHLSTAPSWYSLPIGEKTKIYDEYTPQGLSSSFSDTLAPAPLLLSTTASYDKLGNLVKSTDNYGTVHETSYCPLAGNKDCPKLSGSDYPFETLVEQGRLSHLKSRAMPLMPEDLTLPLQGRVFIRWKIAITTRR